MNDDDSQDQEDYSLKRDKGKPQDANKLTVGPVILLSTFDNISVSAMFTGDANANATCSIRYRKQGSPTWCNAFAPMYDRRPTVGGQSNALSVNQARVSIVGLEAGTPYEVRATWSDPDGIVAPNPVTSATWTKTYVPPANGGLYFVDGVYGNDANDGFATRPWATIPHAIASTLPGDTIKLHSGTYPALTITGHGSPTAYRVLMPVPNEEVVIGSAADENALVFNGCGYWRITGGIRLAETRGSAVRYVGGCHDLYVEDIEITDFATAPTGTNSYGGHAFTNDQPVNDIYILRNSITYTGSDPVAPSSSPSVFGVILYKATTLAILDCVINAPNHGIRDAIGNGTNNAIDNLENCDFGRNAMNGAYDDAGFECDGAGKNLRAWGNRITATHTNAANGGPTAWSTSAVAVGPTYIFRNVAVLSGCPGAYGIKENVNDLDPGQITTYYFHNVVDTSACTGNSSTVSGGKRGMFRNNIFVAHGNVWEYALTGINADYDLGCVADGGGGHPYASQSGPGADYATRATFAAATGQEIHGLQADPMFVNPERQINTSSPARNMGVVLNNFNSLDSSSPYTGTAPDMGAF